MWKNNDPLFGKLWCEDTRLHHNNFFIKFRVDLLSRLLVEENLHLQLVKLLIEWFWNYWNSLLCSFHGVELMSLEKEECEKRKKKVKILWWLRSIGKPDGQLLSRNAGWTSIDLEECTCASHKMQAGQIVIQKRRGIVLNRNIISLFKVKKASKQKYPHLLPRGGTRGYISYIQ